MMEPGMVCTRINQIAKSHLGDSAKPLKIGMLYQLKKVSGRYGNKTVDWIV
jgi:hypothetical protein